MKLGLTIQYKKISTPTTDLDVFLSRVNAPPVSRDLNLTTAAKLKRPRHGPTVRSWLHHHRPPSSGEGGGLIISEYSNDDLAKKKSEGAAGRAYCERPQMALYQSIFAFRVASSSWADSFPPVRRTSTQSS